MVRSKSVLTTVVVLAAVASLAMPSHAAPPANFQNELVKSGVSQPMAVEWLPDGRMLILQKNGQMLIGDPSGPLPMATSNYMTITNINTGGERGLIDITLDPNFATNNFFYLYYMPASPALARISRFTHHDDHSELSSEVVLWTDTDSYISCCHYGAGLDFGPDGKIYLTPGDKFDGAVAQDLTMAGGSIIRINSDGSIPPDNPFVDGPGGVVDSIWAYGLRNPFRARWDLPSGRYFIGEVGGNTQSIAVEDLHLGNGKAGVNFGWPLCEGACDNPDFPSCDCAIHDDPLFSYPHNGSNASITAGVVYRGNQYPTNPYFGAFFYGDFSRQWIRYLMFDASGTTVTGDFQFDPSAGDVIHINQGPDGAIYYTTNSGQLRRFVFAGGNQAPTITLAQATFTPGPSPLAVNFSGAATDPESDPLTYTWIFGDGDTANGQNVSHTYTTGGVFQAQLQVTDPTHTTTSDPIEIQVGNAPTATITSPVNGALFRAGDVISYTGTATDPDETLGGSNFSWTILFVHDDHTQPGEGPNPGTGGSFAIATSGHDFSGNTGYQFILEVTDSDGLSDTKSVIILPDKVNLTFDTVPSGQTIFLDGIARVTPFIQDTLIDFQHTIRAALTQCIAGTEYTFTGWSDAGAAEHVITVPAVNASFTATYVAGGPCAEPPQNGLVMRLKGDLGMTTTGNSVLSWVDQTINGNDVTPVSGNPQLVPGALNGNDVVSFDGIVDGLGRTGFVGLPTGGADRSMFIVAKYDGPGWGGLTYGNSSCNQTFGLSVSSGAGELAVQGWCGPNDFPSGTVGVGAGWMTHGVIMQGGAFTQYKDGAVINMDSHAFATGSGAVRIGIEQDGTRKIDMDVAEILIYDRALAETERQQVEDYFTQEYFGPAGNISPVANNDGAGIAEGGLVVIDVLFNDSDVDGTLAPASVGIVDPPANGSITSIDSLTGEITYLHDGSATTNDTFTYTVEDNEGAVSNVATVSISIGAGGCPLVSAGLVVHLEANLGVTTSTGNQVAGWRDQAGLGNDLVASGDPILVTAVPALNGQSFISFDGTGDKLERTSALVGLPTGADDRTMFTVIKYDAASVFAGVAYGAGNNNQSFGLVVNGGGGKLTVHGWGAGNDIVSPADGTGQGWLTQSVTLQANAVKHYKDGTLVDTATQTFGTVATKIVIAEETANLGFVDIDVAAVLIYDRALAEPERQQVEAYLQQKYLGQICPGGGNQPPVAINDSAGVAQGGSVVVDVLLNDFDNDGMLDESTVQIVSPPTNGNITGNNSLTGEVTYAHDGSATTTDSFTYTVDDEMGDTSNVATVDITISLSAQCGNDVLESGEECDDGNVVGGDCCAADCTFEAAASACPDDGNGCTDDECNGSGACIHPSNAGLCDDGVFCNGDDVCNGGSCTVHTGNPCLGGGECADSCNEAGDTCNESVGTPCTDDGNGCTDDACNGSGACGHPANTDPCDDGVFCNGADTCGGGTCSVHSGDPCAGAGECADSCNEGADSCNAPAGTSCTDDGNVCTDDQCDGGGACVRPANSDPCDDGLFCNGPDTCGGGTCSVHAGDPCVGQGCNEAIDVCQDCANAADCDDGNVCTDDICNAGTCQNVPNTQPCDDGEFCNGADTCSGGGCNAHAGDPCTSGGECADTCDEVASSCNAPAGSSCTDDGNVCTDDECDGSGGCARRNNSAPCEDGVFCNGADTCSGGVCQAHTGDPCVGGGECADLCDESADTCFEAQDTPCTDDGDICTDDICDGLGACAHALDPTNDPSCEQMPTTTTTTTTLPGEGDCPSVPRVDCLTAERGQLQVKDGASDSKDQVKWKWQRGQATDQARFGDPLATTAYALCVYDSDGGVDSLAAKLAVEPNGLWQDKAPKGWKLKVSAGTFDGIKNVLLRAGAERKAKAQIKAKGEQIPMPSAVAADRMFRADPHVIVQLVNSNDVCWTTQFDSAKRNEADQYKAKAR